MSETFLSLMSNAAHWEWELTATFVQDVLIGLLLWPGLKRRFNARLTREHRVLDLEHGVKHMRHPVYGDYALSTNVKVVEHAR